MDEHSFVRPSRLIDRETGEVELRLYAYHLERLHGPWQEPPTREEMSLPSLPFPFLPGVEPVTVLLRKGARPDEIAAHGDLWPDNAPGRSWNAYVLAPFGWALWPHAWFQHDRLAAIQFWLASDAPPHARVRELRDFVASELGTWHAAKLQGCLWSRAAKLGEDADVYEWLMPWGHVSVYLDPREGEEALLSVRWR